jgi:flagellar hook-length control protein FliK
MSADVPLEAIPEAKSETSAMTAVKGLMTDPDALASAQVSNNGAGSSGNNSSDQETFFMLNALKREMKAPSDAVETPADLARNLAALTNEAPRSFGVAQIEGALQPNIDTQKLIDKIMDGVFRPPVQLPKVVTLDLNPAHLGKLQVQVSMHDDGVRVQMTTANPLVKAALEQGMQDLKTAMNNSGLQLGHLDVNVSQDNQSRSFAQHQQQQQGNGSGRLRSLGFGSDDALDNLSPALGRAAPARAAMAALSAINAFA